VNEVVERFLFRRSDCLCDVDLQPMQVVRGMRAERVFICDPIAAMGVEVIWP
jgi:hypothetical protein